MKNRRFVLASAIMLVASAGAVGFTNPEHNSKSAAKPTTIPPKPSSTTTQSKPAAQPAKPEVNSRPKPMAAPSSNSSTTATEHAEAGSNQPPTISSPPSVASIERTPTAEEAMALLLDGNARWVNESTQNPNIETTRRRVLATDGQRPFVTILTCADSRLPVERIFDRGVGDIFVTRVAGNVVGSHEAGTVEYGLDHLHTPLLVVMGHTGCGAVKAALGRGHAGGNIDSLLKEISPAVDRARAQNPGANDSDLLAAAVRENVWQSVFDLMKTSATTRELMKTGKVKVVGAICDISTGKVEFLGEHPWQEQLVDAISATATSSLQGEH